MFELIAAAAAAQIAVSSPDGSLEIRIAPDASGYSVSRKQDGATAKDVERTTTTASDRDKLKVVMTRGGGSAIVLTKRNASR